MFLLILATFLSFISVHSSLIGKLILKWINRPSTKEMELLSQRKQLKAEQSKFSITDEFAKYSKFQRKINKVEEVISEHRSGRNSLTLQIGLTYGLKIFLGLLLVVLSVYFRHTPVLIVDKKIDLTPFNYIISFPNGNNWVSFHFWALCSSTAARLIKF